MKCFPHRFEQSLAFCLNYNGSYYVCFEFMSNTGVFVNVREWFTCTSRCSNHTVTCPVLTVTWIVDGFLRSLDLHYMRSEKKTAWNRLLITRNSARLRDQRGRYAFSCSPFTIHVCHLLPASNIDIRVYYLFTGHQ